MTARDQAFHAVVADGGALGAAAFDRGTRRLLASHGQPVLAHPGMLDVLIGGATASCPITQLCGGPPVQAARELFVAGARQALFCAILRTGEVVVVTTPPATSVALGWTLVRNLVAAMEAA